MDCPRCAPRPAPTESVLVKLAFVNNCAATIPPVPRAGVVGEITSCSNAREPLRETGPRWNSLDVVPVRRAANLWSAIRRPSSETDRKANASLGLGRTVIALGL